ncbi:hypothetical protein J32TS6_38540 [Virgibacillus pantothenticus]|nr:hypothetical protein J32TS6_38540 [Virgibacillus pantothenticus]
MVIKYENKMAAISYYLGGYLCIPTSENIKRNIPTMRTNGISILLQLIICKLQVNESKTTHYTIFN